MRFFRSLVEHAKRTTCRRGWETRAALMRHPSPRMDWRQGLKCSEHQGLHDGLRFRRNTRRQPRFNRRIRRAAPCGLPCDRRTSRLLPHVPHSNTRLCQCEGGSRPSDGRGRGLKARTPLKNSRSIGPLRAALRFPATNAGALRPARRTRTVERASWRSEFWTSSSGMPVFDARAARSLARMRALEAHVRGSDVREGLVVRGPRCFSRVSAALVT